MYDYGYLAEEHATYAQRQHADAASRSRLARLAAQIERGAAVPTSAIERLTAAFRPAPQTCPSDC